MQINTHKQGRKGRYMCYLVIFAVVRMRRRSKRSRHRKYVLQQWLQTQRSFNLDLNLAINYIQEPLLHHKLIDNRQARILCSDFEQMVALSNEMVSTISIVERQKNMNKIVIGPQLIKFGPIYKLTSEYFGNRLKSQKIMKKLFQEHGNQMKAIEGRFQEAAKKADPKKQHMTMAACLQQPQYRMFKYGLLLRQYAKKMPSYHEDYKRIRQAIDVFEQISTSNNDKMVKLELAEKKVKLNQLAGRGIDSHSQFRAQMSANCLYFPVKLYILNNLIVIAKVQRILSFQQERKYVTLFINQFSYVQQKTDGKYYKNGLIICSQYQAIHLFTEDAGSRLQIVRAIQKVISELQVSAVKRRLKQKIGQQSNKLTFALNIGKQVVFAPELRVEVLHIEVRPLGTFTNDTVYLTKFAAPLWQEDCELFGLKQGQVSSGPWQLVEVHMSKVVELYDSLCQQYPQIQFPKVDPVNKEMNVWTQGKKKTIMYEQRGFLFEQFFNFILRNPTVMKNPMQIIHKHKILPTFWEYLIKKNDYLTGRSQEAKKDVTNYLYSATHCKLCHAALNAPLQQLQKFRSQGVNGMGRGQYCFNSFYLARLRLIAESDNKFHTLERMLVRQLAEVGRLDYSMIPRDDLNKRYQEVSILTCGQSLKTLVLIDYRRKIGQILLDLGTFHGLGQALDCRILLRYQGKERILDQDEVLFDLITKYKFPVEQKEDNNRQSRYSYNVTTIKKEQGLFSFLSQVFSSRVQSCLVLRKIVYLPKEIQIQAIMRQPARGKYIVQELFSRLSKGQIQLQPDDWAQACSIWLLLFQFKALKSSPISHLFSLISDKLIPPNRRSVTNEKIFQKVFGDTIQKLKKMQSLNQRQTVNCYRRTIRVFYRSPKTYTYLSQFTVRTLPHQLISDNLGPIYEQCWLGVNYKELLVYRTTQSMTPAVKLSLTDIKVRCSTFSMFIDYSPQIGSTLESGLLQSRRMSLRFDGRLLYHFRYLLELYQNLRHIFPNTVL